MNVYREEQVIQVKAVSWVGLRCRVEEIQENEENNLVKFIIYIPVHYIFL